MSEEIRLWVFLTPIDEAFILCLRGHGNCLLAGVTEPTIFSGISVSGSGRLSVV